MSFFQIFILNTQINTGSSPRLMTIGFHDSTLFGLRWSFYFIPNDRAEGFTHGLRGYTKRQITKPVNISGDHPNISLALKEKAGFIGNLNRESPERTNERLMVFSPSIFYQITVYVFGSQSIEILNVQTKGGHTNQVLSNEVDLTDQVFNAEFFLLEFFSKFKHFQGVNFKVPQVFKLLQIQGSCFCFGWLIDGPPVFELRIYGQSVHITPIEKGFQFADGFTCRIRGMVFQQLRDEDIIVLFGYMLQLPLREFAKLVSIVGYGFRAYLLFGVRVYLVLLFTKEVFKVFNYGFSDLDRAGINQDSVQVFPYFLRSESMHGVEHDKILNVLFYSINLLIDEDRVFPYSSGVFESGGFNFGSDSEPIPTNTGVKLNRF